MTPDDTIDRGGLAEIRLATNVDAKKCATPAGAKKHSLAETNAGKAHSYFLATAREPPAGSTDRRGLGA